MFPNSNWSYVNTTVYSWSRTTKDGERSVYHRVYYIDLSIEGHTFFLGGFDVSHSKKN